MAHYSVIVAVENGRLVARATMDFLRPVPAAALLVAPGDEVLWFCESGGLQLLFEGSPFASGIREINVPRGKSSKPETGMGRAGRQRQVFRYTVRFDAGADRRAEGVAYVIVEAPASTSAESQEARREKSGAKLGRSEEFIVDTREGELLDRARGEDSMADKHKLKIKKSSNKVDYEYEKNGSSTPASQAIPYLFVKKFETVEFEAPNDGVVIIAFNGEGSPFVDGTTVWVLKKGEKDHKTIWDPGVKKTICYKYTTVLLEDLGANIFIHDPQIIIDNTG